MSGVPHNQKPRKYSARKTAMAAMSMAQSSGESLTAMPYTTKNDR